MKDRWALSSFVTSVALASGLMPLSVATSAQPALWERGILTCSLALEDKSQASQGREALCQFRLGDRGADETYVGTFQIIGQDKLPPGSTTIMLVVKTPVSKTIAPGLLQQIYSAAASAGAGKQSPLVVEKDSSIVLQSASAQPEGHSMALGQSMPATIMVAELKLKSSPA